MLIYRYIGVVTPTSVAGGRNMEEHGFAENACHYHFIILVEEEAEEEAISADFAV